jgi:GGDEF domain-containing protein
MAIAAVIVAGLVAIAAIAGWMRCQRALDAARREADVERAAAADDRRRHEQELERMRGLATRQQELLARLQQSWRAEREWNRELRGRIARQDPTPGPLDGKGEDVRALVLKAAIELTESERGLLLSREDADDDGELDLVVAHGFAHDPTHSAVAQRFARAVLERDEIVREDSPTTGGAEATPADEEIDSLVAVPLYLRDRFHGVVVCANRPGGFEALDDAVLLALGDHASAALHQGTLRRELHEANRAAIRTLVETVAIADPLLHEESSRLIPLALHLTQELGMSRRERDVLLCALLLRGVGNLALPERVLHAEDTLAPEERGLVEVHPRVAFNVIGQAPTLRDVATTVLYHQERYDGDGYPAGLAGDDIPRTARVLAVLEAYGAMTEGRPYRDARSPEEACEELVEGAGSQFDPEIAARLVEVVRRSGDGGPSVLSETILEALPFDPAGTATVPLGPLGGTTTDGLTLLGDRRALQQGLRYAVGEAGAAGSFAVAVVQVEDLERINAEASFLVGDRVVQVAADNLKRAAVRLGGTAYRMGGRRLALVAPLRDGRSAGDVQDEVWAEFAGGPAIRVAVVEREPDERAEQLMARVRRALDMQERSS